MNVDQGKAGRAMKAAAVSTEIDFDFHLPDGREKFRIWEVAKILHHSEDHVQNLIDAGAFGPVADFRLPGATKASVVIPRTGLVRFIQERKR
jgi:hypothetical protein